MKTATLIVAALALARLVSSAGADAPMIYCVGTEGGGEPRLYAYDMHSANYPMMRFRVGTNDLDPDNYSNVLIPESWSFAVEPVPQAHLHGVRTAHGEISAGPCRCLTAGSVHWWTDDPQYAVEFFTFGYDHPWTSEDVGWGLEARREGTPPQLCTFSEVWDEPVGVGYGPVHGPGTDHQWGTMSYAFVPGQSDVIQNGGFGGWHEIYGVTGEFKLTVDYDAGVAWFDTVEATVSGGPLLPEDYQDLNTLFDMTELVSTAVSETVIELAAEYPPPGGKFVSLTLDFSGDSIHLTGGFGETWLDGFCYTLDAVAVQTGPFEGDLDNDGFVGQGDLDVVMAMWGNSGVDITDPRADVNADAFVGQADLDYVLADWGQGTPPAAPAPEPATLTLSALGGLAMIGRNRRRASQ